jgi:hypothetical protein
MLHQSGGARIEAPREGGRRVAPFKSLTAVSLLALVGAAGFAPAQAADLNGKVSTIQNDEEFGFRKPEVYDWSGVYVGYSDGEDRLRHELDDGSLAGGHLGFNHQFGRWVGGAEVSLSDSDVASNEDDFGAKTEIDKLFLATVRLGYAWDRSLAYVKGGYASADLKLAVDEDVDLLNERH